MDEPQQHTNSAPLKPGAETASTPRASRYFAEPADLSALAELVDLRLTAYALDDNPAHVIAAYHGIRKAGQSPTEPLLAALDNALLRWRNPIYLGKGWRRPEFSVRDAQILRTIYRLTSSRKIPRELPRAHLITLASELGVLPATAGMAVSRLRRRIFRRNNPIAQPTG